jgi:hypothetical protein
VWISKVNAVGATLEQVRARLFSREGYRAVSPWPGGAQAYWPLP